MSLSGDVRFAEIITSPEYRRALNDAYEQDPYEYNQQQLITEDILYGAAQVGEKQAQVDWEVRRLAAIASLKGAELGVFGNYVDSLDGQSQTSNMEREDLDLGETEPVKTNSIIKGIDEIYSEPIDFLEAALQIIDNRKKSGPNATGPENYASVLKYFVDKYSAFPSQHLDKDKMASLIKKCTDGFTLVSQKDKPNFVEMTNIYHTIRILPRGVFPAEFTKVLVGHSLEQLPTYHRKIFPVMFGALAKLSIDENSAESAILLDLAMRQFNSFETTSEMRMALRAIANLQQNYQANFAFKTFLELRNDLEIPMDIGGLDETSELLKKVVNNVINDTHLTLEAKEVAKVCAGRAVALYKQAEASGDLSDAQIADLRGVVDRIVTNWSQI